MSGMNKVILEGNISKIDTKEVNGKKVTDLQLAVNAGYKDKKTGEWVDKANFVPVKKWGLTDAQLAVLTVGKGLRVEGEITTDVYKNAEGKTQKSVYVTMDKFEFTQSQKKEQGKEKQVEEPEHVFG